MCKSLDRAFRSVADHPESGTRGSLTVGRGIRGRLLGVLDGHHHRAAPPHRQAEIADPRVQVEHALPGLRVDPAHDGLHQPAVDRRIHLGERRGMRGQRQARLGLDLALHVAPAPLPAATVQRQPLHHRMRHQPFAAGGVGGVRPAPRDLADDDDAIVARPTAHQLDAAQRQVECTDQLARPVDRRIDGRLSQQAVGDRDEGMRSRGVVADRTSFDAQLDAPPAAELVGRCDDRRHRHVETGNAAQMLLDCALLGEQLRRIRQMLPGTTAAARQILTGWQSALRGRPQHRHRIGEGEGAMLFADHGLDFFVRRRAAEEHDARHAAPPHAAAPSHPSSGGCAATGRRGQPSGAAYRGPGSGSPPTRLLSARHRGSRQLKRACRLPPCCPGRPTIAARAGPTSTPWAQSCEPPTRPRHSATVRACTAFVA